MSASTIPATELEMRAFEAPRIESAEDLAAFIKQCIEAGDDYGRAVYSVSLAAHAAFRFVAGQLGITGFQAGCADFDLIRRTRHLKGPFMLIDAERALFPQYDLTRDLVSFLAEAGPWLGDQARVNLAQAGDHVHADVLAHWRALDEANPAQVEAEATQA